VLRPLLLALTVAACGGRTSIDEGSADLTDAARPYEDADGAGNGPGSDSGSLPQFCSSTGGPVPSCALDPAAGGGAVYQCPPAAPLCEMSIQGTEGAWCCCPVGAEVTYETCSQCFLSGALEPSVGATACP
jgi:hypothetical protein